MKRKVLAGLAALVVGALALTGCSSGGGGAGQPAGEQTLRFGISGEAPVLKPGGDQGNLGLTLNSLIHRGLVTYDGTGEIIPALASKFEKISPKEYRFTLRDGLTFHDGTPLTLESVENSWKYFADPAHGAVSAPTYADVESIEAGTGGEFTVKLKENNNSFLQVLADINAPILPQSAIDAGDTKNNNVGAGPFRFVSEDSGVGMTLEKFDGYFDAANVALGEVRLSYYADGAARANALMGGDVDLIDYVPWESFDQLEQSGFVVDGKSGPGLDVQFNFENEALKNPKVREAIGYAIDRDKIVDNVFSGNATPVYGQIVPDGSEYDTPLATDVFQYDPEKAKQLLAEAGYASGLSLRLLSTSQYAFMQDMAISVQQDLEAVGISTTLDLPDWPTMMDSMTKGNYEIGIGTISASITDPSYLMRFVQPPAYVHPWGYDNPELVAALQEGRGADSDEAAKTAFDRAFTLLKQDTPYAVLVQRSQAYAHTDKVTGFSTLPGLIVFYSGLSVANVSVA